ncbi:hypothetical protein OSTOST_15050 [Ostertagia ostertagi]
MASATPLRPTKLQDGLKKRRLEFESSPSTDFLRAAEQLTKDDAIPLHIRTILAFLLESKKEMEVVVQKNSVTDKPDAGVETRDAGGGVAIITKRMYSPQVVYSESVDEAYELISVDLDMALCKVRFVLAYRSPSCSTAAFEQLLKAIGDLIAGINTFFVLGDFNLPDIPWTDVSYPNPPGSLARRFLEMCDCLKLYQVVSEGTHGSNILDLVLTNNKEVVKDVVIRAPIGSSDHASVLFKLDLKIEEVEKLSLRRDFKKANFNDILTYLTNHEHLPQHLERLSRKKNSLWKKAVVSDSPAAWEAYKGISCIFEKRLYKFRSQVEKKIIYSRNKNNLYRFLSTRLGKKKALGILLDENGVVITK